VSPVAIFAIIKQQSTMQFEVQGARNAIHPTTEERGDLNRAFARDFNKEVVAYVYSGSSYD
jgi:hypothetical protein